MDAISVLWIQSRQTAHAGSLPAPPKGWKIDLFLSGGGLPEFGVTEYAAIVLDFSTGVWGEQIVEQVQGMASRQIVVIYDPSNVGGGGYLGAASRVASPAGVFPRLAQAIEVRRTNGLALLAERAGGTEDTAKQDWERLLVGESHPMRQVGHIIRMVGARRATVLITGETGTGKEVAARALHLAGPRRSGPLVAVNCNALPENLLEAELFGHVRGAFTGAHQSRTGRFEQAHGGTLFLDEIGEMPLDLQAKLLRVLQEREFQRLGSSETVRVDVRVVAATNCHLGERMDEGRFREDLFYRLNVVPIHMPPLRARREDIPALAAHFARKICAAERIPLKRLTGEAVDYLGAYAWPGNVRQLENAVEMAIALSGERLPLGPADFPLPEMRARAPVPAGLPVVAVPDGGLDYERTLALIERSILEQALQKTGGNKKAAAQMLRLKRTTLSAKVRSLDSRVA
ncbi:MAG: sigma-54 interaction domain-containing protein [Bryobacteraceae bacterium]